MHIFVVTDGSWQIVACCVIKIENRLKYTAFPEGFLCFKSLL